MNRLYRFVILVLLLSPAVTLAAEPLRPKLLLMITVDQLRADMAEPLKQRFSDEGFRYLMERGTLFSNAHYRHANTLTAVGHATLFTGGHTPQHGMAGNYWYDAAAGRTVYCVADPDHPIIDTPGGGGISPVNLTAPTIGDALIAASSNRARVFSVSGKDRGAVIPGGHQGKAFWYSARNGHFVSSTYYYDAYPAWVKHWNDANQADHYRSAPWTLLHDADTYIHATEDDRPAEQPVGELGRTFPHPAARSYSILRFTPMADELLLDFVTTLMKEEQVGRGPDTDLLAVSFSATDYIGHMYGPNSLEAEDNLLRLDLTLARLLRLVDQQVGLDNTLIVLSSDHGVDAIPEYRTQQGLPAGRLTPEKLVADLNRLLRERLSISDNLITQYWHPNIYLDTERIKALHLEVTAIEELLAEELSKMPAIRQAVTRTALLRGDTGSDPLAASLLNAFHPTRSGNLLIIPEQYWNLNADSDIAAAHGSPYTYDTHVPILFAGPRIPAQRVARSVSPADIAVTLARLLNIPAPAGATGQPLAEVLHNH